MHIFAVLLLMTYFPAYADVYKCERIDGSVYYQDRDCNDVSDKQSKLLSCIDTVSKGSVAHLQQKNKPQPKKRNTSNKKATQDKKKRAKKRAKCAKVKQEIAQINSEYRYGYTAKRREILDKRLVKYKSKCQELCAGM